MNFLTKLFAVSGLVFSIAAAPSQDTRQRYAADVVLTASNTITLDGVVDSMSVARTLMQAKAIDSLTPSNDPIYLVLNTPGGSIDAGLSMIEQLSALNRPVVTVTLFAASMGFQTVQGVPFERLVTPTGTLMSHRPKGGFMGEFSATNGGGSQVDTRYTYYRERVANMDKKAVERTKGKMTYEEYEALIASEYWCDGKACMEKGFADKVVTVICDSSMAGTREETQTGSIFGMSVKVKSVVSNCPLITGSPMDSLNTVNGYNIEDQRQMDQVTNGNREMQMAIRRKAQELSDSTHPNDFLNEYLLGMRQVISY